MDHFQQIYAGRAAEYHHMIAPEDAAGRLRPALEAVLPAAGRRVLDLGTGTGRLPLLLAREAARFTAFDLYRDMLRENARQRARAGGVWQLAQADMRVLPLPDECMDLVLAGWSLGHWRGWEPEHWLRHLSWVITEMRRVTAPGGAVVICETLGTGALTPAPPTPGLAEYYAWLENAWGFTRQVIATDYQFASVEDAVARTEFFFGPELAQNIRANGWARLPEWTGVWSWRKP